MPRVLLPWLLGLALAAVACAPTYQSVQLVNRTDRRITEVYIYPAGSAQRGASRATLAPGAATTVQVPEGNIDVVAVSERVRVDDTTSETRTASQTLELKGPLELVFHDSTKTPPGLERPQARGIMFRVEAPASPPPAPEESDVE